MKLPVVKYGDVFEIKTSKGLGYFQCVKETSPTEAEIIRVFSGVYETADEAKIGELVKSKELYFVGFPLKYAIKKNCVKFVGNYEIPNSVKIPRYYRSEHIIGNKFICWHIVDSVTWKRKSVNKLSASQLQLSEWGSWNDTLLAERIAEGWTLDKWK